MSTSDIQILTTVIEDRFKGVTHQLDEIDAKLDSYGDRITRVEMSNEHMSKKLCEIENAPAKKRENWKTWIAIIGGLLGVAAIIIPVFIAIGKLFGSLAG